MKLAVLSLGLWLVGAQAFAAQACCSQMPTPKTACDSCGDTSTRDTSSTPDCCTSLEAQKDLDVFVPRSTLPEKSVVIELLPGGPVFVAWHPETTELVAQQAAFLAEGPSLYLRNSVLLI